MNNKDKGYFELDHVSNPYEQPMRIYWLFALPFIVLVVDVFYVLYVPDGLNKLEQTFIDELAILQSHTSKNAIEFIYQLVNIGYKYVFIESGLLSWYSTSNDDLLGDLLLAIHPVFQAASVGFRLFILRLSVCILLLPFIFLVFGSGLIDGLVARQLRRVMAERESGWIYHRSKRLIFFSIILFWVVYIVPPFVMDPRYILPPFIILMAISLRVTAKYFKKHL